MLSDGLFWAIARWGKCRSRDCALQHLTVDQQMKVAGHDAGTDIVSLAGKPLAEDVDGGNSQKERVDRHETEGKIDMITLLVAVRRRLRRPRWCKDYMLGCLQTQ